MKSIRLDSKFNKKNLQVKFTEPDTHDLTTRELNPILTGCHLLQTLTVDGDRTASAEFLMNALKSCIKLTMTNCKIGRVSQKIKVPNKTVTRKLNLSTSELQFELTGSSLLEIEDLRIRSKSLQKLKEYIDPFYLKSITFCGTQSLMPEMFARS